MSKSSVPEFQKKSFRCPHCSAFSQMQWDAMLASVDSIKTSNLIEMLSPSVFRAICAACGDVSLWLTKSDKRGGRTGASMAYPMHATSPLPSGSMPASCRGDYLEARAIERISPRGAAALLRLCIQKLLIELGQKGRSIDDDIGALVAKKVIPTSIQEALDVVRVVGNNSLHPGEIAVDEEPSMVSALFILVNQIVDYAITQPNATAALYASLPEGARAAVKKRDGQVKSG